MPLCYRRLGESQGPEVCQRRLLRRRGDDDRWPGAYFVTMGAHVAASNFVLRAGDRLGPPALDGRPT